MKIYYFTRSGRSRAIAEQLAKRYETSACVINDHINWQGKLNYMRAALMALCGKALPAKYQKPEAGEQVAVVFPLWAGKLPPAVKSFANEVGRENIICIVTSLGSKLTDRDGFVKVIDLVGDPINPPEEL